MSKPKIPVVARKQVALWSEGSRLCERGARRSVERHGKRSNHACAKHGRVRWTPIHKHEEIHKHVEQLKQKKKRKSHC